MTATVTKVECTTTCCRLACRDLDLTLSSSLNSTSGPGESTQVRTCHPNPATDLQKPAPPQACPHFSVIGPLLQIPQFHTPIRGDARNCGMLPERFSCLISGDIGSSSSRQRYCNGMDAVLVDSAAQQQDVPFPLLLEARPWACSP